jgi:hypothetical protein
MLTIECNYPNQTRGKLLADLNPVLDAWMLEEVNNSAQLFEKSKLGHFYCHTQVLDTPQQHR